MIYELGHLPKKAKIYDSVPQNLRIDKRYLNGISFVELDGSLSKSWCLRSPSNLGRED